MHKLKIKPTDLCKGTTNLAVVRVGDKPENFFTTRHFEHCTISWCP